jgi:alcohol dehydrogenase class IV
MAGIPDALDTLVVVGGGTLLDAAKAQRRHTASPVRLIAVPSLWGSGAEASPIVVITHPDRKEFLKDDAYLPDVRVLWPGLAESVPPALARYAGGDAWAHAVEGFCSPLASGELRGEIVLLVGEMLALPLAADPRWYDVGARACAAQARSSVGLIHGIAHTLEPVLRAEHPDGEWGHARLCALYLWPTLRLMRRASTKADTLAEQYGLDLAAVEQRVVGLFEPEAFDATLPVLEGQWTRVLRDPCTRTSCFLARGEHLRFFTEKAFQ